MSPNRPRQKAPLHSGGKKISRAWWLPAKTQYTRTTKATINSMADTKWIVRIQPKRKLLVASPPIAGGGAPMK